MLRTIVIGVLFLFSTTIFNCLCGQVAGTVKDQEGHAIPFVSIYVLGTSVGTSSNEAGRYELNLQPGSYQVVFQQIGYDKVVRSVVLGSVPVELNVELKVSNFLLNEIEFVSSREDPAYEIIRKAISKRKEYGQLLKPFRCKAYTKGVVKVLAAPQKVLGQKIGNLGGLLDTAGKGILYLSEAESFLESADDGRILETMISSKIAGNDRGFSFNRASSLDFNLYENSSSFGRAIISPLADYAFNHYRYRLVGSRQDSLRTVHKIRLIPKVAADAAWQGHIYIDESDYSIYEFDGFILGSQCKQEIFDTIWLSQKMIAAGNDDAHKIRNQLFKFYAGFFGFEAEGRFTVDYSSYDKFIGRGPGRRELLVIQDSSNKKDMSFWNSIRPVPLLEEEAVHYRFRDSLQEVRDSRRFKDSMDLKQNRFNYGNLLTGYTFRNSYKRTYLSLGSPVNSVQFNPVQGVSCGAQLTYNHYTGALRSERNLEVGMGCAYGFSDDRWLPVAGLSYYFNPDKKQFIRFRGGRSLEEFNYSVRTNRMYNQVSCLLLKRNALRLYQKEFFEMYFATDLDYNTRILAGVEYSTRSQVNNTTDYSLRLPERKYEANRDYRGKSDVLLVREPRLFKAGLDIQYTPFTEVWKTPGGIDKVGSRWPDFKLSNQLFIYDLSRRIAWMTELLISHDVPLYSWGQAKINLNIKNFNTGRPDVPEAIYPSGNPFSIEDIKGRTDFKVLRNYDKIGHTHYCEWHIDHNMEGYFFDRVPFLNKLGLTEIWGVGALYLPESKPYYEFSFGLGNIGYKAFRLLRLDWVQVREGNQWRGSYLRVGVNNFLSIGG